MMGLFNRKSNDVYGPTHVDSQGRTQSGSGSAKPADTPEARAAAKSTAPSCPVAVCTPSRQGIFTGRSTPAVESTASVTNAVSTQQGPGVQVRSDKDGYWRSDNGGKTWRPVQEDCSTPRRQLDVEQVERNLEAKVGPASVPVQNKWKTL